MNEMLNSESVPPSPPARKVWYRRRWVLITAGVVAFIIIVGNLSNKSSKPSSKAAQVTTSAPDGDAGGSTRTTPTTSAPTSTAPPTTTTTTTPPPPPPEVNYPFAQLVKEADGPLTGKPTTGTACIFQFDSSTGTDQFLGDVTDSGFSYWSDAVLFALDSSTIGNGFYQGDIVTYHGSVYGTQSYKTRIGGTNTVPVIEVTSMEKTGSGCN